MIVEQPDSATAESVACVLALPAFGVQVQQRAGRIAGVELVRYIRRHIKSRRLLPRLVLPATDPQAVVQAQGELRRVMAMGLGIEGRAQEKQPMGPEEQMKGR